VNRPAGADKVADTDRTQVVRMVPAHSSVESMVTVRMVLDYTVTAKMVAEELAVE